VPTNGAHGSNLKFDQLVDFDLGAIEDSRPASLSIGDDG
jgi:hypothetical protein